MCKDGTTESVEQLRDEVVRLRKLESDTWNSYKKLWNTYSQLKKHNDEVWEAYEKSHHAHCSDLDELSELHAKQRRQWLFFALGLSVFWAIINLLTIWYYSC